MTMEDSQDKITPQEQSVPQMGPVAEIMEEKVEDTIVTDVPIEEFVVETPTEEKTSKKVSTEPQNGNMPQEEPIEKVIYQTKEEVLKRISELAHGEETPEKAEIDLLKTSFYKFHLAERDAQYKKYIEDGGAPEAYTATISEVEEAFKAEMTLIREKRAEAFRKNQEEQKENYEKKLTIIEQIKAMVTSPEEANKSYKQFRELQQKWREIKNIPAEKANILWRNYQLYVEQFYDLLKLNNEAREYDFKKNLELKTHLCEAAEKLADEEDVISAFHQLQKLHQEFREIGPVAKELRDEIWNRFKTASTIVNKRHQAHFEELKGMEEENLAKKTTLCEQMEEIAKKEVKNGSEWDKLTKVVLEIQAEWKKIGFAPQKMNVKIFERFRIACDSFFAKKAEYFSELKTKFAENAEKKRALITRAHELEDSTDWKKTTDEFIQLQKDWKQIGMTTKKLGDALWEEFLTACNKFFESRNAAIGDKFKEERENLAKKKDVIRRMKELCEQIGNKASDETKDIMDKLIAEFNGIGHVPFRDKDKIYKEYREISDNIRHHLNITFGQKSIENFRSKVRNIVKNGEEAILDERARLMRQYELIKQEVQTYENNLGFLNAASKTGNSLIEEMNRKVNKLKSEVIVIYNKIKALDEERKMGNTSEPKQKAQENPISEEETKE